MTANNEFLREVIHKPVTFTEEKIQRDTDELNKSLSLGYQIHDYVKTETGIVYVLGRWERQVNEKIPVKDTCENRSRKCS